MQVESGGFSRTIVIHCNPRLDIQRIRQALPGPPASVPDHAFCIPPVNCPVIPHRYLWLRSFRFREVPAARFRIHVKKYRVRWKKIGAAKQRESIRSITPPWPAIMCP